MIPLKIYHRFGFWEAELIVALCASTGATISFFFSKFIGGAFVGKELPFLTHTC